MAATSVLKLVLDDKEYEASLRDARKGMQDLVNSMRQSGKSFADLDKSVLDYASSIGNMTAKSSDSRTQMRELTQAINDLTIQYRSLTDEEKQSPFGKALNQSIADLTERAGKVKDVMIDTENAIKHSASDTRTFDQLAQGASVATSAFQGLTGAGKLLGIEMGDDVAVIAKLQAAMAVTNSLTTIQTALQKESALMQGLLALRTTAAATAQKILAATTGDATKAQAAFNVVMKANPIGILVTAIGAAAGAFALLGKSADDAAEHVDNTRIAIEKLNESANNYIALAQQMGASQSTIRGMRIDLAKESLETAKQNAAELEKAVNMFKNLGQNPPEELSRQYAEAVKLRDDMQKAYTQAMREDWNAKQVQIKMINNWKNLNTEGEIRAAINLFTQLRSEAEQGSAAWKLYDDRISKLQAKIKSGGGSKTGSGDKTAITHAEGSVAALTEEMNKLRQKQMEVTNPAAWNEWEAKIKEIARQIRAINGGLVDEKPTGTTSLAPYTGNITERNKATKAIDKSFQDIIKTTKTEEKIDTKKEIGELLSSVSTIANSLTDLGVEIPKGFTDMLGYMQAVITILEAIQTINTVGSLLGVFSQGGIVPKAATGMVVPGNSFSGDSLRMIGVNSGEVVLNRAEQGNLLSQLYDGGGQQQILQPYVSGENILLGVNNHLRRSGQGEIVTTNMLRRLGVI